MGMIKQIVPRSEGLHFEMKQRQAVHYAEKPARSVGREERQDLNMQRVKRVRVGWK